MLGFCPAAAARSDRRASPPPADGLSQPRSPATMIRFSLSLFHPHMVINPLEENPCRLGLVLPLSSARRRLGLEPSKGLGTSIRREPEVPTYTLRWNLLAAGRAVVLAQKGVAALQDAAQEAVAEDCPWIPSAPRFRPRRSRLPNTYWSRSRPCDLPRPSGSIRPQVPPCLLMVDVGVRLVPWPEVRLLLQSYQHNKLAFWFVRSDPMKFI